MNHDSPRVRHTVILLICLILFGMPAISSADAPTPAWQCWGPGLPDPCRNRLNDVAVTPGSAGNDVWAVGDSGAILHWDGSAWTKVPSNTTAHLFGVAMATASRGWAVGSDGALLEWNGAAWRVLPPKSDDGYQAIALVPGAQPVHAWVPGDKGGVGFFLYYDGVEWKDKIGDYYPIFGGTVYDVAMVSAGDGWAVGHKLSGATMVGQVLHWDGARWNTFSNPADELYGVHLLSAADGWSVGEAGAAYRWNGAAWSKVATPRTDLLRDVHLLTASDGWAVGAAGAILRWNGSTWTDYTAAAISQELRSVAMASAVDGWAVGDGGVILRWNGSAWQKVVGPATSKLESVALTPGSGGLDGWAVGESRDLLHWDGSDWRAIRGPTTFYYAVSMVNNLDGWVAGPGGRMYRWNGAAWVETPRVESARALGMIAGSDGWAVGWGKIQHWDGTAWTQVASPTTRTLYGIDVLATNDIWAAGDGGAIVHYTGGSWQSVPAPVTAWLTDVSMASSQLGYIVGNSGTILRWNGAAWTKLADSPTYAPLHGVAVTRGASEPVGWAVGDGGTLLQLHNGTWQALASPTGNDLLDVTIVSATEAWAVGEHGVILRYGDVTYPPTAKRIYLPLVLR